MASRVEINDKKFLRMLRKATLAGLKRAAVFYHTQCRLALNAPNTGVRVSAKLVQRQAEAQLTSKRTGIMASSGLIRVHFAQRKKGTREVEHLRAWYWFNQAEHATVKRSVTVYPFPAPPGQPPRKRTGFGQSNVVWESNENERSPAVRIGVRENAIYLYYHEVGIRGVKRPWLVPTLMRHKEMIARLACTGGRGGGGAGTYARKGGGGGGGGRLAKAQGGRKS